MQINIQILLICNIKSINLIRHALLSVNTSARLLKGASCPAHCPTLEFFYLATIAACAFSCSCELVP